MPARMRGFGPENKSGRKKAFYSESGVFFFYKKEKIAGVANQILYTSVGKVRKEKYPVP